MTVGGWLLFGCIFLVIVFIAIAVGATSSSAAGWVISMFIGLVLTIGVLFGMRWYYGNTQSGKRAMKSQRSNFEEGLERTVSVYDIKGDLIQEYSGKFDIAYDAERIIFDDDNGKRHIIYYSTATVIIDEK